jgi:ribosomal protein S27AE
MDNHLPPLPVNVHMFINARAKQGGENLSEAKLCPKCGSKMINEGMEWRCSKCGYIICIEPEYCPPKKDEKGAIDYGSSQVLG